MTNIPTYEEFKILDIKPSSKSYTLIDYYSNNTNIKSIYFDDKEIGKIDFVLNKNINNLYINVIEIIDKSKGIGTNFIKYLFDEYKLKTIEGIAIKSSLLFWKNIGSLILDYDPPNDGYNFLLLKKSFYKYLSNRKQLAESI